MEPIGSPGYILGLIVISALHTTRIRKLGGFSRLDSRLKLNLVRTVKSILVSLLLEKSVRRANWRENAPFVSEFLHIWPTCVFSRQSETLLDLLGGGPTQPEPTPAPVQPPAPASSSGGDLLDLLGGLDLGSTNAG